MLADHVEAHALDLFQFKLHRFLGWIGQQAVHRIALIQQAAEKERFSVEGEAQMAAAVRQTGEAAHREVGAYCFIFRLQIEAVKERIRW